MGDPQIRVSAVVVRRPDGRVLTVRKAGTEMFMFPGGKHDDGESPLQTAVREVQEETGLAVGPDDLVHLGAWDTAAANEAGWGLHAEVFAVAEALPASQVAAAAAEIEALIWMDPQEPAAPAGCGLAPLLVEVLEHVAAGDGRLRG